MPQGAPGSSQDLNSLPRATNTDTHTHNHPHAGLHSDLSLGRSVTVILESERCAQCPPLGRRLFRDAFQVLQAPHVSLSHCGDCLSMY